MAETRELQDDAEITLGTGKLLGIFFGLAVLCAVFFTMGYMLGRGSAAGARTEIVGSVPNGNTTANKPSAGNSKAQDATQNCTPGSANCPPPGGSASPGTPSGVGNSQVVPADSNPAAGTSTPTTSSSTANTPASDNKNAASGSYIVQVAAVSKQEDAEFLVAALRKKQYPVFLSSGGGDAYFRVQVGPFTDPKEAEAMRARLASEGYNPIVKK